MDLQSLARLADEGIASFPPYALSDLSEWCWDYCEATGDARYCSLSSAIHAIANLFDGGRGQPSTTLVSRIDDLLREAIPDVLSADTQDHGSQLSRILRLAIFREIEDA